MLRKQKHTGYLKNNRKFLIIGIAQKTENF